METVTNPKYSGEVWYLWHGSYTIKGEIVECWYDTDTTWYRMLNGNVIPEENIDIVKQDD